MGVVIDSDRIPISITVSTEGEEMNVVAGGGGRKKECMCVKGKVCRHGEGRQNKKKTMSHKFQKCTQRKMKNACKMTAPE